MHDDAVGMEQRVEAALDEVRPALRMDGGDVELVGISDGVAKVRLLGACMGCPMASMTLVGFVEEHGLRDLFHRWTPEEISEVRAKGKIPQLARWRGTVALDDLMSMAALQSFAADQQALDEILLADDDFSDFSGYGCSQAAVVFHFTGYFLDVGLHAFLQIHQNSLGHKQKSKNNMRA